MKGRGIRAAMNDFAERERLLAAIDAQRHLFQTVVEHAPAGIAIYDGESFRVKWANPTYRERLDEPYRSIGIVGRRLQEILPGAEESGIVEIFRKVASSGVPHFEAERELARSGKGTTYWRWSLLPLDTAEHETRDLMILVLDVTDQVTARRQVEELARQLAEERRSLSVINQELELRNREVERANRLKSEFLATMSHELRTPLHSIIGFSELLAEQESGESNPKQQRQLQHILRGARHLLSLINDILDLSKIESGRLELHPESFMVHPALSEVLSTIEPMAAPKQIRIANDIDPQLVIWADRLRFKQILYNLLSNAVKFTPPKGSVAISSVAREESVEMTVQDTGIGIPLEEQTAIFDEFHQAATTTKGVKEGTGLGLAITRRLVEKHSGEIRMDSRPGSGSRFTFSLPLTAAGSVVRTEGGMRGHKGQTEKPESRIHGTCRKLVVADDSLEGREFIRDALGSRFEICEAVNGEEALGKIQEVHPELVLMDIQMPGMDGYAALRKIRQDPEFAKLPVLALTAFAMHGDRDKALAAGFDAYISKPVDPRSLRSQVDRLLEERDSRASL